jgi:alginate O-acetyltransferase complex protein AlgI
MGLAKKVIIADTLGPTADMIFNMSAGVDLPTAWLGVILFALQLFFDFSGYCDMAIGMAAMFGFRLPENFNYPYIARSVGDFWRRWHITLCTWLRDYLYIPLGGSRTGNVYLNLMIVFLISGLWHGVSWNYFLWGAWFGIFMVIERFFSRRTAQRSLEGEKTRRMPRGVGIALTLLVVLGSWVWFRTSSPSAALLYFGNLVGIGPAVEQFYGFSWLFNGRVVLVAAIGILLATPICKTIAQRCGQYPVFQIFRTVAIPGLLVLALIFVMSSNYSPFLYQQF